MNKTGEMSQTDGGETCGPSVVRDNGFELRSIARVLMYPIFRYRPGNRTRIKCKAKGDISESL